MGKNLIQQRRGKGSPTFRAPSFRYAGRAKYRPFSEENFEGEVIDLVSSSGHSAPLMNVKYVDGYKSLLIAPEGIKIGEKIISGQDSSIKSGNVIPLGRMPEGTLIFNIEKNVGDGGKFVRSSGSSARVVAQMGEFVLIQMPSKKEVKFNPRCRATIGTVAGSGRLDKPFLKAGNKFYAKKAKNKQYPVVRGVAMNAVAHPFGAGSSHNIGRPSIAPRNAPAGKKVGKIRPRRTGHRN